MCVFEVCEVYKLMRLWVIVVLCLCPIYCYLLFYLFIFDAYLFIGFATQPTVKLHTCNADRIFNNRCCQNCLAQGTNCTGRAFLARMH